MAVVGEGDVRDAEQQVARELGGCGGVELIQPGGADVDVEQLLHDLEQAMVVRGGPGDQLTSECYRYRQS